MERQNTMFVPRALTLLLLAGCADDAGFVADEAATGAVSIDESTNDSVAPRIILARNVRGAWVEGDTFTVMGRAADRQSGVSTVFVNGEPQDVGRLGQFSAEIPLRDGVNPVTIVAVDRAGNHSSDVATVFAGPFRSASAEAVYAGRVQLGGMVIDRAASQIAPQGLAPFAASDAFTAFSECVVLEGVVDDISFDETSSTQVHLDSEDGLSAEVQLGALDVSISGDADVCGIELTFTGSLHHSGPVYTLSAEPALDHAGALSLSPTSSKMEMSGVEVNLPELVDELAEHDLTPEDAGIIEWVVESLEETVRAAVVAEITAALQEQIPPTVTFDGGPTAEPSAIRAGMASLVVDYAADFPDMTGDVPGWVPVSVDLGAPPEADPGVRLDASLDIVNRSMHHAWLEGALDHTATIGEAATPNQGEQERPADELSIAPQLPPTLVAYQDELWLAVGELRLEYTSGRTDASVIGYANAFIPLSPDGQLLQNATPHVDMARGRLRPEAREALTAYINEVVLTTLPWAPTELSLGDETPVSFDNVEPSPAAGWVRLLGQVTH